MQPDSFWENGAPLPFNDARYSGLSVGVPGTVEAWDEALARYGTISLAQALAAGRSDVARGGFVVDQTFFDQTQRQRRLVQRHPGERRAVPRPGRDAARRRHRLPQPRSREHLRADRAARREGLLPRRGRGRDRRRPCSTRSSSPNANHAWRPGLMTMRDLHTLRRAASGRRRASATAGSTCTGWARPRAAARPSARR